MHSSTSRSETSWPPIDEDPLTGLPNLFALLQDLPYRISKESGLAVLVDVRNMGDLNRRYGREKGDQVIVTFSREIVDALERAGLRDAQVYRTAGDEFCIVAPSSEIPSDTIFKAISNSTYSTQINAFGSTSSSDFTVTVVSVPYLKGTSDSHEVLANLWVKMHEKRFSRKEKSRANVQIVARSLVRRIQETVGLLRETHRLAYTDDISGLPNHRAARYVIEQSIEKCKKSDKPLSLLFIDGDNLRQYNDYLGYNAGNEMIRRLGAVLSSATSPGDLVARWLSGDEFMIVLKDCPREKAAAKALDLCRTVRSQTAHWQYPITISIGVASYPDDALDADTLIKKVEDANQKAKKQGKDRVCLAVCGTNSSMPGS